jgi:hypothetical protein
MKEFLNDILELFKDIAIFGVMIGIIIVIYYFIGYL